MKCVNRICAFIVVFAIAYYMESIGGTYIISVVQSLERQFQIPSRMSGTLISAHEIGYIPTVIFLSYLGSRGNRARWIGAGCLLTAVAHLIVSSTKLLSPEQPVLFNMSHVDAVLSPPAYLLRDDVTPEELLDYKPIREKMPAAVRKTLLDKYYNRETSIFGSLFGFDYDEDEEEEEEYEEVNVDKPTTPSPSSASNSNVNTTSDLDAALLRRFRRDLTERRRRKREGTIGSHTPVRTQENLIPNQVLMGKPPSRPKYVEQIKAQMQEIVFSVMLGDQPASDFFDFLKTTMRTGLPEEVKAGMMRGASAPMGFCQPLINELKQILHDAKCDQKQTNNVAFGVVFCALILLGIGHSMPWTLGLPLLDDNIKRHSLPTYFGWMQQFCQLHLACMFFIKLMGPVSGFVIGAACNKLYVTLETPVGLSQIDPRWIGAWWLGFLCIGSALIIPSLALFCFPAAENDLKAETKSRTPGREKRVQLNLVDSHKNLRESKHGGGSQVKTFFIAVNAIIHTPVYMYCLMGRIFDAFAMKGFFAFLPKYLDNHYGIPQSMANLYIAGFGIVGFGVGIFGGSTIMRCFKLEGRRVAIYCACCSFIALVLSLCSITLGCESVVNTLGKQGIANDFNFTTECTAHCNCAMVPMMPVCSEIGTVYESPCQAGCAKMERWYGGDRIMNFTECSCIDSGDEVRREWCQDDCGPMTKAYFALTLTSGIIGGFGVIPAILIVLRSVAPEWRSISIGFNGFVVSIGTLLAAPFFGYIIDSTCILWEETCDGSNGSCRLYEPNNLRNRLHIAYGILRVIGLLFDLGVIYHADGLKIVSDDDEQAEFDASHSGKRDAGDEDESGLQYD